METELIIGIAAVAAPAVVIIYQQILWHNSYQAHKLQKMDASAAETQATETGQATISQK